ncbi:MULTISPECIES: Na/Pi cotransporter family protein [unclassified Planococcus (in: firmicutes)]|uniref:Na/Pi cotransporter family protein n=1 Tax=Planococcus TaxID=1372 RepID=UPI000C32C0A9|nr:MULTISPECIES: Na/Pi cotransporter family protein [unclassified Planococcus (in: firmicutes)]AUD13764.1 sodium-dependent phosphate transporter [Planococcus sp. MB-3u-03]PKG45756.1 sodium-dependent phosphate transporter [Planococcus sp. Urea-trap-24]PKG88535.1 sodium-dependent phosphate transporter [Planococcus sp. Urea-3u-39]PKH38747.1 sodium-dependent phosphate transporter [Planococcus sp. MB-3u-09]
MEMNWQELLFTFFGGLGIFLFSIKYMGDALQKAAGDKLRDILDRFTTNPFMGVLVGIVVTILIQSSSGTTVIVVGLVSAGFMTLRQAIGVIMGANIGTTVTAFIIGLDVGAYALPIMAVGAFLIFFVKKNQIQNIGQVIFGFGGLFFGMETMSGAMKPLRELPAFIDMTVNLSEFPILGVAAGTIFTFIVQSSSGTIAILQGLYAENLVTLDAALPVLFGDNIGTTVTAVLAALGTSIAARRAAAVHVLFNVIGSVIFLILLVPFTAYVEWLTGVLDLEPKMQIAFAHGTFNVANTLIQFPLIGAWAYLVTKVIPGDEVLVEFKPKHLDLNFIEQSPSIALGQAKEEVLRMGKYSVQGLEETYEYLKTKSKKHAEMGYQLEDAINNLDGKITDYLVLISAESISAADSTRHTMLMETVRDIERIGDHFENIIELIDYQEANKVKLTGEAMEDLDEMFTLTIATVSKSLDALDTTSHELAREVAEQEDLIDKMERKFRKKHILRLNEGACSAQAGIVFVDIVSNLERIGDHSVNIAEAILGNRT